MERPDLRELQAYLEGLDNAKRLGNLQRVLRRGENGSITVRWVCKNHASEWDTTNAIRNLQTAIKNSSIDGRVEFDDETWELSINGLSRGAFRTFRNSVTRALSSVPLRKISIVACEKADSEDVQALINATTTIEILILKNTKNIQYSCFIYYHLLFCNNLFNYKMLTKKNSTSSFIRINNIIRRCPQLHQVILSVCNIDNEEVSILAEILKMNIGLKKLDLKDNNIGEKGASTLAEVLKMNTNIEILDLEVIYYIYFVYSSIDNGIGVKGASTLAKALRINTSLQTLVLRRTGFGKVIGDKGARALAEALKINNSLQSLDLHSM
ncbi:hypothetical protein BC936DRAFT_149114 [Jimgerdemannia flammicorona]|uniref:RNI-like protein n=1 Tax=Jimgerdemannia flammicorona TaxID=994334 RepID=A0A433DKA2_9FUNG|nr:hypothetical protein BC936DRAFT_149114 [Jimgerdemannia flammicorona]